MFEEAELASSTSTAWEKGPVLLLLLLLSVKIEVEAGKTTLEFWWSKECLCCLTTF